MARCSCMEFFSLRSSLVSFSLIRHDEVVLTIVLKVPIPMNPPGMLPFASKSFVIRPAQPQDAPLIVEFNLRLAEETESKRLRRDLLEAGVRTLLNDPRKGRYFVACHEDQIVGQIMHTYEWSDWRNGDFWWIQSVYVHPDFRGSGAFRSLLNHLRNLAIEEDVVGLRLYVEDQNHAAQEVYRKLEMVSAGYRVLELPLQNRLASG